MQLRRQPHRPRVIVVTGASAGLGRAIAHAFADRGDRVALLARNREGLQAAAQEVRDRGGHPLLLEVDVADHEQVEAAAQRVERELGPIEVWVNNAMAAVFAPFLQITPEEFERAVQVTFLGSVNGARAALRRMTARDAGHLIQVGSALAYRGIPLQSPYCASKHALTGFYDSVRAELLHDRSSVHVTSVHLPAMNTCQFRLGLAKMPHKAQPVPPIYQPEVAARAVLWASQHRRREIWVGATTAGTILGSRVIPGLLDHYLGRTGYSSQQTSEPADPDAPNYLFTPVPGDHGTHGPFDAQAHPRSLQLPLSLHRTALLTGLGAAAAAAGAAVLARRGPDAFIRPGQRSQSTSWKEQHVTTIPLRRRPAGPPAASVRGSSGGIGRASSPAAEAVSDALRRHTNPALTRRRRTAGLALAAIGAFLPVAAYQTGLVRHLPDPPLPGLDSDAVDASGEAYRLLLTPDAALGIASYAATLSLATMGPAERATTQPWLPLALAAKVTVDAIGAAYLTAEQLTKHRKLCTYCTAASAFTLAMVPQVLPEASDAFRTWRNR